MNQMTETWLQYTHLDKLYGYLPGMADALPAVFGMTADEYAATCARFDEQAAAAAEKMLTDPAFASLVDTLPFATGQTVLAVGDSITDDLRSWAEILRHLLSQRRPELDVKVVNGGLSAHTTAMVLRRWPATVGATRPDWVLCALGGNDLTLVGADATSPLVSLSDSMTNLRRLRALAPTPKWVWFTPAPMCEDRIAQFPPFRYAGTSWRNEDLRAFADAMRDFPEPLVDLVATFGIPANPDLQGPDGVHPTLEGQVAIARALVETLATDSREDAR
jgi:acyl-CoA thioesterase-1